MTVVKTRHEDGKLVPAKAQHVSPARWDLGRFAALSDEDDDLSEAGLGDWAAGLDAEDRG
jgi:hypothetical protein